MRVAIVVLLLSALAVGQAPKPKAKSKVSSNASERVWWVVDDGLMALGGNQYVPHTLSFSPSGVSEDVDMMRHAKPGDCFRVFADGTLAKVVACDYYDELDNYLHYIHNGTISGIEVVSSDAVVKMIDVPADRVEKQPHLMGPCVKPQGCSVPNPESFPTCFDPDRILIGPDGHNQYWCHLPQR
jgi:hypothetical protein